MKKSLFSLFILTLTLSGCASELPPAPSSAAADKPAQAGQMPAPVAMPPQRPKATGTFEDARRHMLRGMAAVEAARSPSEMALAEDEFRMATEIAPELANAWFNMAKAQAQQSKFLEAIESYREYLRRAPQAEDRQNVENEIIKLEFRHEMQQRILSRAGTWIGADGTIYQLTLQGNRMMLKANQRIPSDEVRSSYTMVGEVPTNPTAVEFRLDFQGNRLSGVWMRGAVQAEKCTVPPDSSNVTGELIDQEKRMVLHYDRGIFHATTQMGLLTDDVCAGVSDKGRKPIEESIYGPVPQRGGLGLELLSLNTWWEGGFSAMQFSWAGRLVVNPLPGRPAYEAGMRNGDEIIAIDGMAVKEMNAGQAVMRLMGEPGAAVTLEVWRKEEKRTFMVTLTRPMN